MDATGRSLGKRRNHFNEMIQNCGRNDPIQRIIVFNLRSFAFTQYSKSPHIRTYFSRARLKLVLISKVLTLISRYRGSYLKDTSCSQLESLTKMFSPIICFGSVLMDLVSN